MRRLITLAVLPMALLASACAQQPGSIVALPASAGQYAGLDCQQVVGELNRVNTQLNELTVAQAQAAAQDAQSATVGFIFLGVLGTAFAAGGPDYAGQIATLKGQSQTLTALAASCR